MSGVGYEIYQLLEPRVITGINSEMVLNGRRSSDRYYLKESNPRKENQPYIITLTLIILNLPASM